MSGREASPVGESPPSGWDTRRRRTCTRDTAACDFWNWGEGHVRPPCCTHHLLELVTFLEDLLTANDVPHWLDFGSLLGAVRDGEFIAWDDDADFGILMENVPRLLELESAVNEAGHVFEVRRNPDAERITRVRVSYSPVNSLHVGFFPWTRDGDLVVSDMDPKSAWPGMNGTMDFPAHFLDATETVRLYGKAYPAPSPVGDFLAEHRFGPDYMTPKRRVRTSFYPTFGQDEMTPLVDSLLDRIAERQQHLYGLWPQKVPSRWRRWTNPGMPAEPAPRFVDAVYREIPPGERSSVVDHLAGSLALVEHAIAEIEGPVSLRLARLRRRARRFRRTMRRRNPLHARTRAYFKRRRRKLKKAQREARREKKTAKP
jgi:hypothetical protein